MLIIKKTFHFINLRDNLFYFCDLSIFTQVFLLVKVGRYYDILICLKSVFFRLHVYVHTF